VVVAGETLAQGSGRRKVDAERQAAAAALENMMEMGDGGADESKAAP
jgi:dsRNA-specific ribonuclease